MRWQTLSIAAAIAGNVSASPLLNTTTTSNSTAPCGIITSQIVEYYNDPSSMSSQTCGREQISPQTYTEDSKMRGPSLGY